MSASTEDAIDQIALRLWRQHVCANWLTITGNSMLPLLRAGDQVQVVAQTDYRIGDILVFVQGREFVVHRIVGSQAECNTSQQGFPCWITQGDNCGACDPIVPQSACVGKVVALRRGDAIFSLDTTLWQVANGLLARTRYPRPMPHIQRLLLRLLVYRLPRQRL